MKQLPFLFLLCFSIIANAGVDTLRIKNFGIDFYGELGLHPGLNTDLGISIFEIGTANVDKKRSIYHEFYLRPGVAIYRLPEYTNNYYLNTTFNYQLRFQSNKKHQFGYVELYGGLGYLRYSYLGEVFVTNGDVFEEQGSGGGNALMYRTGFVLGGSLPIKSLSWLFGAEYSVEKSEDELSIIHPFSRIGFRYDL